MRRELFDLKLKKFCPGCCPGHDDFPCEVYGSRRSTKARSRGKKLEHRYVRRVKKYLLCVEEEG